MSDCACFGEGIAHARGFAHGFDRLADAFCRDARGAEGAQGAQLGEIFKGVIFVGWNQARALPRRKLARSEVQDSKYVLTAISGHGLVSTGTVLCARTALLLRVCVVEACETRGLAGSSSKTRGYRVPNVVRERFDGDFAAWEGHPGRRVPVETVTVEPSAKRTLAGVWLLRDAKVGP